MKRSQISPMPEYFDRYIHMTDDIDILQAVQVSINELKNAPVAKWTALGDKVYAPGKWTVKDILQHLIDTERVFSYRAVAFARGENKVMPFDEELYGKNARAGNRTIPDLVEEAIALRTSFYHLYQSFTSDMLLAKGIGFKGEYSVASIGFIIPGHQRWHFSILEEKYYPLIATADSK